MLGASPGAFAVVQSEAPGEAGGKDTGRLPPALRPPHRCPGVREDGGQGPHQATHSFSAHCRVRLAVGWSRTELSPVPLWDVLHSLEDSREAE